MRRHDPSRHAGRGAPRRSASANSVPSAHIAAPTDIVAGTSPESVRIGFAFTLSVMSASVAVAVSRSPAMTTRNSSSSHRATVSPAASAYRVRPPTANSEHVTDGTPARIVDPGEVVDVDDRDDTGASPGTAGKRADQGIPRGQSGELVGVAVGDGRSGHVSGGPSCRVAACGRRPHLTDDDGEARSHDHSHQHRNRLGERRPIGGGCGDTSCGDRDDRHDARGQHPGEEGGEHRDDRHEGDDDGRLFGVHTHDGKAGQEEQREHKAQEDLPPTAKLHAHPSHAPAVRAAPAVRRAASRRQASSRPDPPAAAARHDAIDLGHLRG